MDLVCPSCGADVPDTGGSHRGGLGDDRGHVSWQPARQETTCENCGADLERNPESDTPLNVWRVQGENPPT
jgi:hypothetical protein